VSEKTVQKKQRSDAQDGERSALFVGNYLSSITGASMYSHDLAVALRERGWKILTTSGHVARLPRLWNMMATAWRERRRYRFGHVDIFSGDAFIWAEAVCWVFRRAGKPYALTLHGGNLPEFARRWPGRVRRLLQSASLVTTPSCYLQERMKPSFSGCIRVPNALNLSGYRYRERNSLRPHIIWLRAFHGIYNPLLAPRVVAELAGEFPDIRLTMAGADRRDGTYRATRALAKKLGVAERIEFSGGVPKEEVPQLLDRSDIFLNTTNVDNTPVSVLEAMASGLCVVSTNVGGIPYMLDDGEDALLSPPDDAASLAQAIRRLLTDAGLAARLSRNARKKAQEYDWSATLPRWEALFESMTPRAAGMAVRESGVFPVLFVGNFISAVTGANSLSEDVAGHLAAAGWEIFTTSRKTRRLPKLADMVWRTWSLRERYRLAHVDVFSGDAFLWAEAVCWVLRRAGKRYILTLRGGNLPQFAAKWPGRVRRLLTSAAAVVVPSEYLRERLNPYCAGSVLLPNSLDLHQYCYRERSVALPRIIWLRAFHEIYNPALAPRVLAGLVREHPDVRMTMVGRDKGDGTYQAARAVARELGVEDRIEFPGGVTKATVPGWLDRFDIFLNTTNVDNTPVSVMEAMACGLCVVSTNVGGLPYLLADGEDALLAEPGDAVSLARAVSRVLAEKGLSGRLSRNARKKVEQFDWSITIPQWETLLRSLEYPADGPRSNPGSGGL
jgi:glycosyltransferase involved in cell wall biosynthesis